MDWTNLSSADEMMMEMLGLDPKDAFDRETVEMFEKDMEDLDKNKEKVGK